MIRFRPWELQLQRRANIVLLKPVYDALQALGAPIAANRGASGIDGIISTAAGFAFGLGRATTLLIGDVSFLHDINGLNLLRTGADSLLTLPGSLSVLS